MLRHCLAVRLLLSLSAPFLALADGVQKPLGGGQGEAVPGLGASKPFERVERVELDVNQGRFDSRVTLCEDVDVSRFAGGVSGRISFAPGEWGQEHGIVVLVRTSSTTSEEALDRVSTTVDGWTVSVNSTASQSAGRGDDLAVDMVAFMKPGRIFWGHTDVWTANLDIEIQPGIYSDTYYMSLYSRQGSITCSEPDTFAPHEIDVKAVNGSIRGKWALPWSISFWTGYRDIDIDLFPRLWSFGPESEGNLTASSWFGDIAIRMPFDEDKLSLRNGTTAIEAHHGSVRGAFVHGRSTSLSAWGSINATLLPFWAFREWQGISHSYIKTESRRGSTDLNVLPPFISPYYAINPLVFTVSRHTLGEEEEEEGGEGADPSGGATTSSRMRLRYPGDWGGTAVGYSSSGDADITGSDFELVGRNDTTVTARRPPAGSDLFFEARSGSATLVLDPCSRPECVIPLPP